MISRLLAFVACLVCCAGSVEAKFLPMKKDVPPPQIQAESAEPGVSEPGEAGEEPSPAEPAKPQPLLKVSFKLKYEGIESSGNFLVLSGSQSNYVIGGDRPRLIENPQGKGVEFKKYGTIVNILPVVDAERPEWVDAQVQVELSGPGRPMTELNVPPIQTFQLQTEYLAPLGKKLVLVDEPEKRVEMTVELVKP